ncbi:MAG: KEOPS complex subunit Pcc1 [archaeon]
MNYKAEISITEDINNIYRLLSVETRQTTNQRASFSLQRKKDELSVKIQAQDSVALRATLNTITKIFTVYEKTRGLIK